tara:strand:+ start:14024 stop:14587 length:564 start_codon:yes stop_codon:yes gene_type:complete
MKIFFKFIFLSALLFSGSIVMAYEEPNYEVVHTSESYEIRHYKERVVVQTKSGNQNNGFRSLFNYISGSNEGSQKISMTTPVTQFNKDGEEIMQFFLPSEFEKFNAPMPTDKNVEILTINEGYFAVMIYSGRSSNGNFNRHSSILKDLLLQDQIEIISSPIKATYNSPFTPFFLRRNEAMFIVDWVN